MNDETQAPQNGTEGDPAPTEAQGTTTLDLTASQPVDGAAETANEAVSLTHTLSPTATATTIPAGVHGVVSKLESELHGEFAKGQTSFLTWMGSIIAEFKAHLKM